MPSGERRQLSPIPKLEFYAISPEEGDVMQKISQAIIQHIVQAIFREQGLRSLFQAPQGILRGFVPFLWLEAVLTFIEQKNNR